MDPVWSLEVRLPCCGLPCCESTLLEPILPVNNSKGNILDLDGKRWPFTMPLEGQSIHGMTSFPGDLSKLSLLHTDHTTRWPW